MQETPCYAEMPWLDIYSKPNFQGTLRRLRLKADNGSSKFSQTELRSIGSIVVGPKVTAEFFLNGQSEPVRLASKTILAQASSRLISGRVRSLRLAHTA
jgi:hypothetical protein